MVEFPSDIISLEEEDDYANILVYGLSGSGKTVFGGSGGNPLDDDDSLNILFLAPEKKGTLSAKRLGSKAQKWKINSWEDLQNAYDWLYDNPDHGFDWVTIDSGTEMQQMLLRAILDSVVKENSSRDLDIPAIQDHQKWQNMFKRMVKAFNDLPVNICWTALARNEEDPMGDDFLTPDIQGKGYQMSQWFASTMTSYGYLEVIEKQYRNPKGGDPIVRKVRRITWEDTGVIRGKDRSTRLAPFTENKTLKDVHQIINGTYVEKKKVAATPAPKTNGNEE